MGSFTYSEVGMWVQYDNKDKEKALSKVIRH